jgi:SAM-dependent methyltransferase
MNDVASELLTAPGGGAPLRRDGDAYVSASGERFVIEDGIVRTLRNVDPALALEIEAQAAAVQDYDDPRLLMPRYEPKMAELAVQGMFGGTPPVGKRVLDAGCGIGILGRIYPMLELVGVDVSMPLLRKVTKGYALRVEGSAEALPFADASFDVIVAMNMLHHVINPAHAIKEFARVLRPGGSLIVIDPRKVLPIELAKQLLRSNDQTIAPTHRAFTVDEYRSLVEADGRFSIEVEKRVGLLSLIVAGGIDALRLPRKIPSERVAITVAKTVIGVLAGVDHALFRLPAVPRAGLNLSVKARRAAP